MKIIKTETEMFQDRCLSLTKWSIAETYSFYWSGWWEVCCIVCSHIFVGGGAFLLLLDFKFTQTIGKDNEHGWHNIASPRWVLDRWWTETFYSWLSFALHLFCLKKKREPGDKNMQKISSCDSENTICTGIDLLHNMNNSHLKPLFTPVHICKNADFYFMSLRFMAFTSRLIFGASSYGTSRVHHGGIVCIIVCLGLCLVTYNRCWWTEWWLFKKW